MSDQPVMFMDRQSGDMLCPTCASPIINHVCPFWLVNFGIYSQDCHKCGTMTIKGSTETILFPKRETK